jgi:hypothetical protein
VHEILAVWGNVEEILITSLGAMMQDKVIDFSSGIVSAFAIDMITRVSPEGTALTFPLSQPDAAMAEAAAHCKTKSFEI